MDAAPGRLLVAAPVLTHDSFARSIVLLLNAGEEGALGVILNRPTRTSVATVLQPWASRVCAPAVLFEGGPVGTDSALGLAAIRAGEAPPVGWRLVSRELAVVDLDTPVELVGEEVQALRIYAGYAGWSPGQLEGEIEEGAWHVVEAEPGDLFLTDPVALWRRVLGRQRGELRLMATQPADPTEN